MLEQLSDVMTLTSPDFPNAKCVDIDPEVFFPEDNMGKEFNPAIWAAKEICFSCVHRQECADFAIDQEISDGIFGGMTPKERKIGTTKKFKPRSDLGERGLRLRVAGHSMLDIASRLDSTPTAIQKAIGRHKQTIEVNN